MYFLSNAPFVFSNHLNQMLLISNRIQCTYSFSHLRHTNYMLGEIVEVATDCANVDVHSFEQMCWWQDAWCAQLPGMALQKKTYHLQAISRTSKWYWMPMVSILYLPFFANGSSGPYLCLDIIQPPRWRQSNFLPSMSSSFVGKIYL